MTSLGPFFLFDTLVVVRKREVAAVKCFVVVTTGGGDMVRWVWCVVGAGASSRRHCWCRRCHCHIMTHMLASLPVKHHY